MIIEQDNLRTVISRRDIHGLAQRLANETHEKGQVSFVIKTSKHATKHKINLKSCCKFSDIFRILRSMTSANKQRY